MTKKINIQGKKVILSNFQETDISKKYLNWLNDPEVVKFSKQRFINHDFLVQKIILILLLDLKIFLFPSSYLKVIK